MSIIQDMANAQASTGTSGNFITHGKGRLVIKDIQLFKGFDDPKTLKMEFVVKNSTPIKEGVAPNAPGTNVVFIKKLGEVGEMSRAKAALLAVLGPVDESNLDAELTELLRANSEGYTRTGTACPARGTEIAYETSEITTKKGFKIAVPVFTHVPLDADVYAANKKALDGE